MAQTRLARGRAAAITAATAAGAITTAISTTATTTTIIPTTTKKGKTICAPPPPLTTTATTAAAAPINRPRRNSRRLASAPAKPAAPSAHVPVNLASEDSEYEKEESRNKTPVPTTSEVHEIFPYLRKMFLDPESGAGVEARFLQWEMFSQAAGRQKLLRAAENNKRGKKRSYPSPTPKQKMATGPPAGTAARLQYLMENQEWPIRVNGDKARDHYWNCLYETRVATHCFASQLPPIPSQNPAARPRAFTTTASTENPEGGELIRVWRLRKEGGVPNELADVPCQGEKKKHPSADVEGEATDDNAELASWRGEREKRQRVC
ncbi:hypothetical protein TWF103_006793 [Orbilia oligospora]|nr:hypothetical protein TWF103_006793 [Orbilia oligospora]